MRINGISYKPTDPVDNYPNWMEELLDGESLSDHIQSCGWSRESQTDLVETYEYVSQFYQPENPEDCLLLLQTCIKGMELYANEPSSLDEAIEEVLDEGEDPPIPAVIAEVLSNAIDERFNLVAELDSEGTDINSTDWNYKVSFRSIEYSVNVHISVL